MPSQRTNNIRKCRLNCGNNIQFVHSVKWDEQRQMYVAGSFIPCNTQLLTGDYIRTLVLVWPVEMRGRVVPQADEDMQGFEPHFGTCSVYLDKQKVKRSKGVQTSLFS